MAKRKRLGRSRNGAGSIRYRPERDCFEIRFTFTAPTGERKRRSEYYKAETEAKRALLERTAAVAAGSYREPQKMLLSAWLDEFLREHCRRIGPNTLRSYRNSVRLINAELGVLRLCDLDRRRLQVFLNHLDGKSAQTVMSPLRAALRLAHRFSYLPADITSGLDYPKNPSEERPALTDAEADELERVTAGTVIGSMIYIARRTGLRVSEVLGLSWPMIDLDRHIATIYQLANTKAGEEPQIVPPKNGDPRAVILIPDVEARLQELRSQQRLQQIAAGSAWSNSLGFVFADAVGLPYTANYAGREFRKARVAAGLDSRVSFHSLRRYFATRCERAGLPGKAISSMLGHASEAFTRQHYMRWTSDLQEETRSKLQDIAGSHHS